MRLIIHAIPERYRTEILDPANQGRLPLAWVTWGHLEGHGWGFLHPWAQLALFPGKGKWGADTDPDQVHEPFLLVRFWTYWGRHRHRCHASETVGRFARGLVWRRKWGYRPRLALLDPDVWVDADGGRVRAA